MRNASGSCFGRPSGGHHCHHGVAYCSKVSPSMGAWKIIWCSELDRLVDLAAGERSTYSCTSGLVDGETVRAWLAMSTHNKLEAEFASGLNASSCLSLRIERHNAPHSSLPHKKRSRIIGPKRPRRGKTLLLYSVVGSSLLHFVGCPIKVIEPPYMCAQVSS